MDLLAGGTSFVTLSNSDDSILLNKDAGIVKASGDAFFSTDSGGTFWTWGYDESDDQFAIAESFDLTTNGNQHFVINPGGNIGIGSANPIAELHIEDATSTPTLRIEMSGDNSAIRSTNLDFAHSAGAGARIQASRQSGDADGMNLKFFTEPVSGSLTEAMRIDSDGNLGVGTIAPNAKLTVEGVMTLDHQASDPTGTAGYGSLYTKTDGSLYYRDGTGTVTDLLAGGGDLKSDGTVAMAANFNLNGNSLNGVDNINFNWFNTQFVPSQGSFNTDSGFRFNFDADNNETDRKFVIGANGAEQFFDPTNALFTVIESGNVGIGTSAPLNQLTVGDEFTNLTGSNSLSIGDATLPTLGLQRTSNDRAIVNFNTNNLLSFGTVSGGANHLNTLNIKDGLVGIGTTSPNAKLTVEGVMTLDHQASDPTGTAGYGSLYTKTDGSLYYRDGTGTVTDLLAGGGGGNFMADGSVPMTGVFEASFGSAASPSIAFNGDEDTGLYRAGTNDIGFATAGLAGMTLFNTGRLSVQHATNPELATWRDDTVVTAGESLGRWLVGDADHNSAAMVMEVVATVDHTATVGDNDIKFLTRSGTSDGEKMRITSAGLVGIGETAPDSTLEINGSIRSVSNLLVAASGVSPDLSSNTATNVGVRATPGGVLDVVANAITPLRINRTGADGAVISFRAQGVAEGNISIAGTTVSYNAFTGSHFASLDEPIDRGLLVEIQGNPEFRDGDTSSEPLYDAKMSTKENSPAILGAFLALNESTKPFAGRDNPYQIMSVGNGDVWVVDNGHDIKVGDYLISSSTPGHAEVDVGKHEVAHIIAKAGQNIDWSQVNDYTEDGKKRVKMTVTFEQFDLRHGMSEAARREISALKEENKMLKEKLDKVIKHLGIEE